MARTNSIRQNRIDPTRPFFAAVGGVDVAVSFARTGLTEAQSRVNAAQTRLAQVDLEPRAIPARVEALVTDTVDDLNQQYVDLAARGRTLVNRIRGQQATQDLKAQAASTSAKVKTTVTQTKKAAGTARTSAKASGTSAKRTATAAKKAAKGAAAKTGA